MVTVLQVSHTEHIPTFRCVCENIGEFEPNPHLFVGNYNKKKFEINKYFFNYLEFYNIILFLYIQYHVKLLCIISYFTYILNNSYTKAITENMVKANKSVFF